MDAWGSVDGNPPPENHPANNWWNITGDRIATFMGWLSDTDEGGATCFTHPFEELAVLPIRGSGLFWINNKRSHKRDNRLKHGGCPVIHGSKEIINNWIFSNDQWKVWNCGIDVNSDFTIYDDFISKHHIFSFGKKS